MDCSPVDGSRERGLLFPFREFSSQKMTTSARMALRHVSPYYPSSVDDPISVLCSFFLIFERFLREQLGVPYCAQPPPPPRFRYYRLRERTDHRIEKYRHFCHKEMYFHSLYISRLGNLGGRMMRLIRSRCMVGGIINGGNL